MKLALIAVIPFLWSKPHSLQCQGCEGNPVPSAVSSGSPVVSISATVASHGKCKTFYSSDPEPGEPTYLCAATKNCSVNVHREWSGGTPGAPVGACVTFTNLPGTFCIPDLTVDGDGSGSDDRNGVPIPCGDSATFSVSVGESSASVQVACSNCPEN